MGGVYTRRLGDAPASPKPLSLHSAATPDASGPSPVWRKPFFFSFLFFVVFGGFDRWFHLRLAKGGILAGTSTAVQPLYGFARARSSGPSRRRAANPPPGDCARLRASEIHVQPSPSRSVYLFPCNRRSRSGGPPSACRGARENGQVGRRTGTREGGTPQAQGKRVERVGMGWGRGPEGLP